MASNSDRAPTMAQVIRVALDSQLSDLHVSLPGRVEKFDAKTQTASIKPLIRRKIATPDGGEIDESITVLPRVPVAFPRAGKFYITWPLKKGDLVELVFTESSRDNYKAGDGGEVDPDDFRRFDLSDAYATPAAYPESRAISNFDADNLSLGVDGGATIAIKEDGNVSIIPSGGGVVNVGADSGADFAAMAAKVDARIAALESAVIAMTVVINANDLLDVAAVNALIGWGLTVTPPYPGSPPGLVNAPVVPPTPGVSVAATKAKVT